jgi:ABC-type amino acid transport system permease subunit
MLPLAAVLALVLNAVAAGVSISRGLPADFGGFLNGDPDNVLLDFLTLKGTAIAPPLVLMVVLGLAAALRSSLAIGLIGAFGVVGYLGEPQTWSFDAAATPIVIVSAALYAIMAVGGLSAVREGQLKAVMP